MVNLPAVNVRNILIIAALIFLTFLFFRSVIVPMTTNYPFETVTKFQGEYHDPIYITFNWISQDELMVGKRIFVSVEIRNLPYNSNQTLKDIQMRFNGLNYFSNQTDESHNKITQTDTVTFKPDWTNHVFKSNRIQIRYINPVDESVQLYDYNLPQSNVTISGVIHPAPHDTYVQIDTERTNAGVSLAVLVATIVIVWSTIGRSMSGVAKASTKQKWLVILSMIAMGLLILLAYYQKLQGDNS